MNFSTCVSNRRVCFMVGVLLIDCCAATQPSCCCRTAHCSDSCFVGCSGVQLKLMASPPPSSAASCDVLGGDSDPPLPVEQHSVGEIDVTGSSSSARSKFTTTVNLGGHEFTDTSGSSPGITDVARNDSGMAVAKHVAQSSAPLLPVLMLPPGIISVACGASHALFITRRCVSGPFVPCQWP